MRLRLTVSVVLAILAAAAVHVLLRGTYWDYSEGVYALSGRLMLHGAGLYDGMIGAQPPGVFLFGTAALALHDGLEWLRACVAVLQVAAGAIAGVTVWRLTRRPLAAVLAAPAVLLTPWAVREHGALLPELVALPLLLAMPLITSEVLVGLIGGLAVLVKFSFVLPVAGVLLAARRGPRALLTAAITVLTGLALTTALAGGEVWRDVVYAQSQTGLRAPSQLVTYWAQAAWNLVALLVLAWLAVHFRSSAGDPSLMRRSLGLAAGALLTLATTLKQGTSLNVIVPVEAALVPLAVSGVTWALARVRHGDSQLSGGARAGPAVAALAAVAFLAAQTTTILGSARDPRLFTRPGSGRAWAAVMTREEFAAATAAARRCPEGLPFGGPPIVAFAADRNLAGGQPDQFILTHARTFHALFVRLRAIPSRTYCG